MSAVISLCTILSFISVLKLPFGGTVTLGQSVPLIFFSFKNGAKYGAVAGILCGIIKIIFSFNVLPAVSMRFFLSMFVLDYLLPYALIGISNIYTRFFKRKEYRILISCIIAHILKFCCFMISGALLWSQYIPYNLNIWKYSFIYNFSYMLPETIIACIITFSITNFISLKNHTF